MVQRLDATRTHLVDLRESLVQKVRQRHLEAANLKPEVADLK